MTTTAFVMISPVDLRDLSVNEDAALVEHYAALDPTAYAAAHDDTDRDALSGCELTRANAAVTADQLLRAQQRRATARRV